jgi:uncharacterized iron-regulated protein
MVHRLTTSGRRRRSRSHSARIRDTLQPTIGAVAMQAIALAGCTSGLRSAPLDPVTQAPAVDDAEHHSERSPMATNAASEAAAEPRDVRGMPAFSVATGLPMRWDSLAARAAAADVLILAERHDDDAGQRHAAELFDEVLARAPGGPALALEFLERDAQTLADDFATGLLTRDGFAAALAMHNRGADIARRDMLGRSPVSTVGMPLLGPHLAMAHAARDAGVPVIAANAPRRYVALVRADGRDVVATLTPEQRRLFVLPDEVTTGAYRDRFYGLMSEMMSHGDASTGKQGVDIDALYLAQNIWDATMADGVVRALDEGRAPVVLVVGQFHADFTGGLVTRIAAAAPEASVMVVSYEPTLSPRLREEDADRADVVVYSGEATE